MATAYIGKNSDIGSYTHGNEHLWYDKTNIITKLGNTNGCGFNNSHTGPATGGVFELASDQYPTGVSFSGATIENRNSGGQRVSIYLCDKDNEYSYKLIDNKSLAGAKYQTTPSTDGDGNPIIVGTWVYDGFDLSKANKSNGNWTALAGKTLALRKVGGASIIMWGQARATITLGNVAKAISISQKTGGTVTASKSTATRGETVDLNVSLTDQYWHCTGMTASAGTIKKISDTKWQLTMPTPAANVSVTPTYSRDHLIVVTDPEISFSQNEYTLTVTKGGTAIDTLGDTVNFRLLRNGVKVADFVGNNATVTLTDEDLEKTYAYTIEAYCSLSKVFVEGSFMAAAVHKTLGYYAGSEWKPCIAYVWTGSQWQEVWPYYWTGSAWQLCSQT